MKKHHLKAVNPALWLLALALAGWTLWQLPVADMLTGLARLNWWQWWSWAAINCAILYLAVVRWQVLAASAGVTLSATALFRLRQAGSAVSFITPGPQFGGEPLQLYWLHRIHRLPLHRAAVVLGLERFMETAINIAVLLTGVLMLLGTAILPVNAWLQVSGILLAALVGLFALATLLLRHPEWLAIRLGRLIARWRGGSRAGDDDNGWVAFITLVREVLSGQRLRLWLALGLSLAVWLALFVELVMLLGFLGLSPTPLQVVLIMVGMRLAMLLPMPGGIGTIEASLYWSFSFLSLTLSAAAGLIALSRLRDAVILIVGLACLSGLQRHTVAEPASATTGKSGPTGSTAD